MFLLLGGLVRFSSSTGAVSTPFGGEIARGKHLFPFRTEPLSLSAPMVLGGQPPGRVGRRRSFSKSRPQGRLFFWVESARKGGSFARSRRVDLPGGIGREARRRCGPARRPGRAGGAARRTRGRSGAARSRGRA